MIYSLLNSNIIQLGMTALFGAGLYLILSKFPVLIKFLIYLICCGIILSALFNIGEVYIYSDFYKRAFFYFTDDITTILMVCLMWSLWRRNHFTAGIVSIAMFLSGGKVAFVLFVIALSAFWFINKHSFRTPLLRVLLCGLAGYIVINTSSYQIKKYNFSENSVYLEKAISFLSKKKAKEHYQSCTSVKKCLKTQFGQSLMSRYLSSVAGLWMTLQGGFAGKAYPNTKYKFAALMMKANPWGINDSYNLTYHHWRVMKGVQNPYLAFGAGYGPWLLLLLILIFAAIGYCAISNLRHGEAGEASLWSITFLVIVIFNQTQSWLKSGSIILILLGFCVAHILITYLKREFLFTPNTFLSPEPTR